MRAEMDRQSGRQHVCQSGGGAGQRQSISEQLRLILCMHLDTIGPRGAENTNHDVDIPYTVIRLRADTLQAAREGTSHP